MTDFCRNCTKFIYIPKIYYSSRQGEEKYHGIYDNLHDVVKKIYTYIGNNHLNDTMRYQQYIIECRLINSDNEPYKEIFEVIPKLNYDTITKQIWDQIIE